MRKARSEEYTYSWHGRSRIMFGKCVAFVCKFGLRKLSGTRLVISSKLSHLVETRKEKKVGWFFFSCISLASGLIRSQVKPLIQCSGANWKRERLFFRPLILVLAFQKILMPYFGFRLLCNSLATFLSFFLRSTPRRGSLNFPTAKRSHRHFPPLFTFHIPNKKNNAR